MQSRLRDCTIVKKSQSQSEIISSSYFPKGGEIFKEGPSGLNLNLRLFHLPTRAYKFRSSDGSILCFNLNLRLFHLPTFFYYLKGRVMKISLEGSQSQSEIISSSFLTTLQLVIYLYCMDAKSQSQPEIISSSYGRPSL